MVRVLLLPLILIRLRVVEVLSLVVKCHACIVIILEVAGIVLGGRCYSPLYLSRIHSSFVSGPALVVPGLALSLIVENR